MINQPENLKISLGNEIEFALGTFSRTLYVQWTKSQKLSPRDMMELAYSGHCMCESLIHFLPNTN